MATTTGVDISVVLSGGGDNLNPDNSIGGSPSLTPVTSNIINNLFNDISSEQNLDGVEDYRCIYFFNDGETIIYNVEVFISEDYVGGAGMEIGVSSQDESQRILVSGIPTGGSVAFSYDSNPVVLNYNSNLSTMALDFQNALNSLVDGDGKPILEDVSITVQPIGPSIIFDLLFSGQDGKKDHPTLTISSNDFTPAMAVVVSTIQAGNPVNTIASEIGNSTTPPGGVGFFAANSGSPITLPKLHTGDGFPLWIKRVVPANTEAKANDGFNLRFQAESLGS